MNEQVYSLATLSLISCIVAELHKAGSINVGSLIENVQGTANRPRTVYA